MGNSQLVCASGGGVGEGKGREGEIKQVRMLLPDGNIVLMDGPVEAADLMIEHINHMVMHCSAVGGAKGERTTMTILQPHEKLQPGQAYVLHPIPAPSTKKGNLSQPKQFSVPNLNSGVPGATELLRQENGEIGDAKDQKPAAKPFKHLAKTRFLQKYRSRVADSSQSQVTPAPRPLKDVDSVPEQQKDMNDHDAMVDEATDDGDVLLNLNMYMGWRPALESIPESPRGNHHNLDMAPLPPMLCI